jgi:hypothetical protein
MRLWNIVQSRLRSVFLRDRREADLREELQFHLERETERLEASGLPPETARLQALRLFGGPEQIKEACRDARGTRLVDDAIRDVRYALRGFRRTPLVACAIVATVALGLGLVVVAFTFLNALLFNVDQVPNIHEMFAVERPRTSEDEPKRFTRGEFDALRRETSVFTDSYAESGIDSRVDGRPSEGTLVTGNFFQVLGVGAACRRRPVRGPAGDGPERPRLGETAGARPGGAQPHAPRQRGHLRSRRCDAETVSGTDRQPRGLLGAVLDGRSPAPEGSRPRS